MTRPYHLPSALSNVGIGTTAPVAKLQVAGSGKMWTYVNGQKVAWFKD